MGAKGYPLDTKLKAKALWIVGNLTDAQIAEQLDISRPGTIGDWRAEEGWDRERAAIQKATEARVAQAVSETIAEMNTRHLKECQLLQSKGIAALRRLDPTKASEAAAMIEAGLRTERLVRGEPTEITEIRAMMESNVQVLELCVADVMKVLLDNKLIDGKVARQFADLFAEKICQTRFRYRTTPGHT
jgi:hypothetical protein